MVYVIRVLRWQMLIKVMRYETKFHHVLAALSISYFVSFIIPRLGEITRCLYLKKQHRIPFLELAGTVIIERIMDIVCLLILLLITLMVQFNEIIEFVKTTIFYPLYHISTKGLKEHITLIILLIVICLSLGYLFYYSRKRVPSFILHFVVGLKNGLVSISNLKQKKLFILYTFLIWVCYYLMTYFWFFVFAETSALTWGACLSIVAIGTIGRSLPIQGGGMGAYHFLVTGVAVLYGLNNDWAKALATLIHAGQVVVTFAMGLLGLFIFSISYWRRKF